MFWIQRKSPRYNREARIVLRWIRWWEKRHPGEEMVFLTLPKYDQEERHRRIQLATEQLMQESFIKK